MAAAVGDDDASWRAGAAGAQSLGRGRTGQVILDKYKVLSQLGAGGMGEVYEVEHLQLGRRFAAKFLRSELVREHSTSERFFREARAMAMVTSEYVAGIVDVGILHDATPFIVMDRLVGEDLRTMLQCTGPLSVQRATRLVLDAAWGLRAVHNAGLVHRDVKPANLFVTHRDRGDELCKILDFGVAKHAASGSTQHGTLLGTLPYMAPEQVRCEGVVDSRTDIYALGAVLYEALVGSPPHRGDSPERVMFAIMNHDVTPPYRVRKEVPRELSDHVMKALARAPTRRFATVEQLATALAPHAAGGSDDDSHAPAGLDTTLVEAGGARRARLHSGRPALLRSGLAGLVAGALLAASVPRLLTGRSQPRRSVGHNHTAVGQTGADRTVPSQDGPRADKGAAAGQANASMTPPTPTAGSTLQTRTDTMSRRSAARRPGVRGFTVRLDAGLPWLEAENPYGKTRR